MDKVNTITEQEEEKELSRRIEFSRMIDIPGKTVVDIRDLFDTIKDLMRNDREVFKTIQLLVEHEKSLRAIEDGRALQDKHPEMKFSRH